jgi:hypothetical protein
MTERPRHGVLQVRQEEFLGVHRHGARFDLRQIQDVADQVQQVGPRTMDGSGKFDLTRCQVAVRVVAQLLPQYQNRVQWRTQLVRHVGEEFGLVLGCQREFRRLLLHCAPRLLDLLVLALHLDILFGELLHLLLQLLVGLLQFALAGLQLGGELLGLLQQALGLHRGLDRIQHDADARGELLDERYLQIGERTNRCKLDHRFYLPLVQHRQHDHVVRRHLEQARADRHHIRRKICDQQPPAVHRALTDQPLPHIQMLEMARLAIVCIGGQQLDMGQGCPPGPPGR